MKDDHRQSPSDPQGDSHQSQPADEEPQTSADDATRTAHGKPAETERIGHYRLLEGIGTGGMGEVYRAEQTEPVRRTVAIKIIKRGMDTAEVITRFEAERQALALMDHPYIAKVFDAGSTPRGRPYFVMEYVRGVPITTYADKHRLSIRRRIELFVQLCEGVQHAHQKAIIHRDLKPSNVLVATQENEPVPKIIDFGVAKATAQKLTEKTMYTALGALIGTPEYMSPEQAEMTGEDIDTRTDVYSLGIILYELLAGSLPFEPTELRKAGFEEIIRTIREQDPPRPSTKVTTSGNKVVEIARARCSEPEKVSNQLRGDLDWITMKALEKDRTLRYGSAAELAADLLRHLKHEPVLAGPPSAAYRMRKFVRRHRAGVSFAGVVVVLLMGFAVTMAVQADRIAQERDRANVEAQRANTEAERASREAQAAQEVTDFIVGLFDTSDPRVALGDTITALAIMELGAERIEKGDVAQAPLQQARLLETMSRVYQNLGLYDRAGGFLEKAAAIRRREQGETDLDLARTLSRLGWLRGAYQRNLAAARGPLFEAVAIQVKVHGPDHIEVAWSLYYLGSALSFGQDPSGLEYLEQARTIFEDTLGAESLPVAWCWNDIANSLLNTGEYGRALECYERAVEIKKQILPSDHPDLTISLSGMGALLLKLGRCEEAQPIVEQVLQLEVETLGWGHDETASSLLSRGRLYRCLGRYDEAREDVTRSLDIFRQTQSEDYDLYASGVNELSLVALETTHSSDADSLFRTAIELIKKNHGSDSAIMAEILEERAMSLRRIGQETEATALEDSVRAIRLRRKKRTTEHQGSGVDAQ